MAKASGLEFHSSRSKGYAKAREGETCRLRPRPSRHEMRFPPLSPQAGANLYLLQPDSRCVLLPRRSRMGSLGMSHRVGGYLSPYLQACAAIVLTKKSSSRSDRSRRHSHKNEAEQVFTKTQQIKKGFLFSCPQVVSCTQFSPAR
jgi:hypothetical protein